MNYLGEQWFQWLDLHSNILIIKIVANKIINSGEDCDLYC